MNALTVSQSVHSSFIRSRLDVTESLQHYHKILHPGLQLQNSNWLVLKLIQQKNGHDMTTKPGFRYELFSLI